MVVKTNLSLRSHFWVGVGVRDRPDLTMIWPCPDLDLDLEWDLDWDLELDNLIYLNVKNVGCGDIFAMCVARSMWAWVSITWWSCACWGWPSRPSSRSRGTPSSSWSRCSSYSAPPSLSASFSCPRLDPPHTSLLGLPSKKVPIHGFQICECIFDIQVSSGQV